MKFNLYLTLASILITNVYNFLISFFQIPRKVFDPMFAPSGEERIRHVILYVCHRRNKTNAADKSIKSTYCDGVVCERTCRMWFSNFRSEETSF